MLLKRFIAFCLAIALWFNAGATVAFAQNGDSPTLDGQRLTQLRELAFTASRTGDFVAAEQYWTEIPEQLPDNAAVWSNRGNIRVSLNRLQEAIADYNRAIELAPMKPDPYLNRGAALEGVGEWQAAIADYNQVLALNPEDAAAYNNRGNAKAGQGDWDGAIADYQKAVELAPNSVLARTNTALALYQVGQVEASLKELRNLVRKYPRFADSRAALTAVLWVQGFQGEAESNWVAAVGSDRRYKDLDWVAHVRRWPPAVVSALERFLTLS